MAFNMSLWKVWDSKLEEVQEADLEQEDRLEDWIMSDPSILGIELLLIGRQVSTAYGGRIDLLGIDRQGDIVILELKRKKTPREVVAQVLDYASWVRGLTYRAVDDIASGHLEQNLSVAFSEYFGEAIPEKINTNHRMVIVASQLDDSSERIVQYLAEEYDVNVNVIFFTFFRAGSDELVGRAWLMDPEEVQERSESRKQAPWSGYWFVNVGEGTHRNWDDNRRYGFVGAGQGKTYSRALKRLHVGDPVFAYMKGLGYVGFGEVTKEAVMARGFIVARDQEPLFKHELKAPQAEDNSDNPELSEWVVGVNWIQTFEREEARTFKGIFANQNVVCKLRHQATFEYLKGEFGIASPRNDGRE